MTVTRSVLLFILAAIAEIGPLWGDFGSSVHQAGDRQLIVDVDRLLAALSRSSNADCMQSA
jgi:hypothetical protein